MHYGLHVGNLFSNSFTPAKDSDIGNPGARALGPSLGLAILSCPLELRDPGTGEVVFSCRPSLTGDSLLKTATSSGVKLKH